MAKAKYGQKPPPPPEKIIKSEDVGETIPTPENIQARKPSLVASKLASGQLLWFNISPPSSPSQTRHSKFREWCSTSSWCRILLKAKNKQYRNHILLKYKMHLLVCADFLDRKQVHFFEDYYTITIVYRCSLRLTALIVVSEQFLSCFFSPNGDITDVNNIHIHLLKNFIIVWRMIKNTFVNRSKCLPNAVITLYSC